ncbi:hypothetical protein GCM10027614_07420 [Micromonospora vulcania]
MGVSLKDIAERAGVSLATVSNVVNGYRPVGEHTRQRVQKAIDELGYSPNLSARHLRRGRTGLIALAIPELNNPTSPNSPRSPSGRPPGTATRW